MDSWLAVLVYKVYKFLIQHCCHSFPWTKKAVSMDSSYISKIQIYPLPWSSIFENQMYIADSWANPSIHQILEINCFFFKFPCELYYVFINVRIWKFLLTVKRVQILTWNTKVNIFSEWVLIFNIFNHWLSVLVVLLFC